MLMPMPSIRTLDEGERLLLDDCSVKGHRTFISKAELVMQAFLWRLCFMFSPLQWSALRYRGPLLVLNTPFS